MGVVALAPLIANAAVVAMPTASSAFDDVLAGPTSTGASSIGATSTGASPAAPRPSATTITVAWPTARILSRATPVGTPPSTTLQVITFPSATSASPTKPWTFTAPGADASPRNTTAAAAAPTATTRGSRTVPYAAFANLDLSGRFRPTEGGPKPLTFTFAPSQRGPDSEQAAGTTETDGAGDAAPSSTTEMAMPDNAAPTGGPPQPFGLRFGTLADGVLGQGPLITNFARDFSSTAMAGTGISAGIISDPTGAFSFGVPDDKEPAKPKSEPGGAAKP